jgi:membrane protease YdiL (CAAX protease family)
MSVPLRNAHPTLKALVPMVFIIVIMLFTTAGSGNELNLDLSNPKFITMMRVSQLIGALIIFVAPAFIFAHLLFEDRINGLTLNRAPKLTILFLSVLLIIAAQPMISWIAEINEGLRLPSALAPLEAWMRQSEKTMKEMTEAFLSDRSYSGLAANLFIIAFIAAFGEELLFRGVLQKTMIGATRNIHVGVWLTAIIFSAVHMQFFGFIPRMLLGAVLGYLYVWSGSIWVPVIVHFINNGAAVLMTFITGVPDPDKLGKGGGMETTDPILGVSSIAVTIGLMWLIARRAKPTLEGISTRI